MAIQSQCQPGNFSFAPDITLRRVVTGTREEFELVEPITYDDRVLGVSITVPNPAVPFRTDLTSVPAWFTWLVPKSGQHLPAALIHDGLVPGSGQIGRTYTTYPDLAIDRIEADRVFRDAMRDTGVGVIRRWLVWAAVSAASLVRGPREDWPWWKRGYFAGLVVAWFTTIGYFGVSATADLADRDVRLLWDLPWIVEDGLWQALVTGLSGAIALPLLFSVLWFRWWKVGAIAGVALATLIHVTVAVGVVALLYQGVEWVAAHLEPVAIAVAISGVLASSAIFVGVLVS